MMLSGLINKDMPSMLDPIIHAAIAQNRNIDCRQDWWILPETGFLKERKNSQSQNHCLSSLHQILCTISSSLFDGESDDLRVIYFGTPAARQEA